MSAERPYRFPTEEEEREELAAPPEPAEPAIDKSGPIRKFFGPSAHLQESIDRAIARAEQKGLLNDQHRAAVIVTADGDGARLVVVGKKPIFEGAAELAWSVAVEKPWHGKPEFGSEVVCAF